MIRVRYRYRVKSLNSGSRVTPFIISKNITAIRVFLSVKAERSRRADGVQVRTASSSMNTNQ